MQGDKGRQYKLSGREIGCIQDALVRVGDYGRVHLVVRDGQLCRIVVTESRTVVPPTQVPLRA
jgi:hypothetical protein